MIRKRARFYHARDGRWARGVRLAWGMIASGAIALMCAGTASASCGLNDIYDTPLPVTAVSPADGSSVWQSASTPVSFSLVSPVPHMNGLASWSLRVTTRNVLGGTGILSDLYSVDEGALVESTTNFGVYRGASLTGRPFWTNTPGMYYWQIYGEPTYFDPETGQIVCTGYASPVYTLTVTAPPPPPVTTPPPSAPSAPRLPWMTVSTGRTYTYNTVSGVLPRVFHHRYGYKASCTRRSAARISCNVRFSSGPNDYWGTVTSSYRFGSDNSLEWVATYTMH